MSVRRPQLRAWPIPKTLPALTEVHVPESEDFSFAAKKPHLARVLKLGWLRVRDGNKSKYYGNWYGNRLA
ncbi:MAG: hypothetical protein WAM69_19230, partial [Candidatus Sulfotelmatobacter sp.]